MIPFLLLYGFLMSIVFAFTKPHKLSCSLLGKKPRTKAPRIQRLVTPRVLQHKRRRISLKRQRTQKNKEEASEYAKLLAKRMKVCLYLF